VNIDDVRRRLHEIGVIPVVRARSLDEARQAVEAICDGGIPLVEITTTVPAAPAVIRELIGHYGRDLLVGAGTVLNAEQAESCLDAGAEFVVSPGLSVPVLRTAQSRRKLAIPGALTPTELMAARDEGASIVKIFPCGNLGGPGYIKALRAPFPDLGMIPTGGVNLSNAREYMAAGSWALGVGADLVDPVALRNGDLQQISAVARKLVEAVRSARSSE
jgi:2-dehydro-3-deoxyphosphogluconate aldolase / (4S)-4-hydroxy-2-oxoglutarate aldolase